MTQEEVDSIYEYLHENYEYRDNVLWGLKESACLVLKIEKNKFEAYIYFRKDGKAKQKIIGYFSSQEEAHAAYLKAKAEHHETNT